MIKSYFLSDSLYYIYVSFAYAYIYANEYDNNNFGHFEGVSPLSWKPYFFL